MRRHNATKTGVRVPVHHLLRDQVYGEVLSVRAAEEQLHVQLGGHPYPPGSGAADQVPRGSPDARKRPRPLHGVVRKGGVLVESGERAARRDDAAACLCRSPDPVGCWVGRTINARGGLFYGPSYYLFAYNTAALPLLSF